MFKKLKRNWAIKRYALKLPLDLIKCYGRQHYYSRNQVDASITRKELYEPKRTNNHHVFYAYAMYCCEEEFNQIVTRANLNYQYTTIRKEIASVLYTKGYSFSFSSLEFDAIIAGDGSSNSSGFFGGAFTWDSLKSDNR